MATALFFSFLGSLIICMALIPPLMASAGRLHVLDMPGGRKLHTGSVAKVGGIALAAGTFIGVLMWAPKDDLVVASLLGGVTILFFGVWDDRVGLGYRTKFAGQALAAFIVLAVGGVQIGGVPLLPEDWFSPWIGLPLTFLALIAVTNAVNLADGLDGLAGGLSLISFAGIAYLAFQTDDVVVMVMVMSVLGGLLGFLRFNTYPARVFMGDAGSQFLGFYLGVTALILTDQAHGPYSPIVALFIWGLPPLDTLGVIVQRYREGRSPFVGDRNHLHHKLLNMGFSHRKAVVSIYMAQAAMVALGYGLRWQPDWLLTAIYLLVAVGVLALVLRPITEDVVTIRPGVVAMWRARGGWQDRYPQLVWLPTRVLAVATTVFLVVSVALPVAVPPDAGLAASILLLVLAVTAALVPRTVPLLVRTGLYVGSTFLLYFIEIDSVPAPHPWLHPLNLFLAGLALLVFLVMRLHAVRQFETTPLDSLMVLLALLLPFLPELHIGDVNLSLLTAKLIVLFFSFELSLYAYADRISYAGFLVLWLLGGFAVRAWW